MHKGELILDAYHADVPGIKVIKAKERILQEVPLTLGVLVAVIVIHGWKVNPFWKSN